MATLGEVADVLRAEFGVYHAQLTRERFVEVRDRRRLGDRKWCVSWRHSPKSGVSRQAKCASIDSQRMSSR
jgi:hypothetical protein